jgi:hypothetical protein
MTEYVEAPEIAGAHLPQRKIHLQLLPERKSMKSTRKEHNKDSWPTWMIGEGAVWKGEERSSSQLKERVAIVSAC